MKRILVAVDESEGARAAVDEALELAAEVGATITFVAVRPSPPNVLGAPFYAHAVSADFRRADRAVAFAMAAAGSGGVEADFEILEGDPADEIVSLADNRGIDMIVIGSRGLSPLAGALLGSVSHAVVQHANVPVVVAKQRHRDVVGASA